MFRGNHPARVDEKGRLKVPSEFKAALEAQGRECFITSRDGQRAEIHSLKDWEQLKSRWRNCRRVERRRDCSMQRTTTGR